METIKDQITRWNLTPGEPGGELSESRLAETPFSKVVIRVHQKNSAENIRLMQLSNGMFEAVENN